MIVSHVNEVKGIKLPADGPYHNVTGRVLISPETGWADYTMRFFEVGTEGYSADHAHDFPHIVFVTEGSGVLILNGEELQISAGAFAYIPNNSQHQLRNTASDGSVLKFTCIVPQEDHVPFE